MMSDCSPHDPDFAAPLTRGPVTAKGETSVERAGVLTPEAYDPAQDPALIEASALMNAYMLEQTGYVPCNSVLDIAEAKRKLAQSKLQKPMKATTLRKDGDE